MRSFNALALLWQDLTEAMPEIVLTADDLGERTADESDFLLQRRVIEINDGILALRPYRSQRVQDVAESTSSGDGQNRAALVEAGVVKAALASMRAGAYPEVVAAPSATDASVRKSLRDDTEWFLLVAEAYTRHAPVRVAGDGQPEPVGA